MDHLVKGLKGRLAAVEGLEQQFRRLFFDTDQFLKDVSEHLGYLRVENSEALIVGLKENHFFDENILTAMCIIANGYGGYFKPKDFWNSLIEAEVILKYFRQDFFLFGHHIIDIMKLANYLDGRTFTNIFLPASYLFEKYSDSIVAIDVKDEHGDDRRGSGFIIGPPVHGLNQMTRCFVVTCKHNIEGKSINSVTTAAGRDIDYKNFMLSDSNDIAIAATNISISGYPLSLEDNIDVFDSTYTLGFPRVPRAHSSMLGHRGEVNAIVDRYIEADKVLIVSNFVSPGSSGCPVLDRFGRCVGMTINWLEEKYLDMDGGESASRFSAALRAEEIRSAMEKFGFAWWDHASA